MTFLFSFQPKATLPTHTLLEDIFFQIIENGDVMSLRDYLMH